MQFFGRKKITIGLDVGSGLVKAVVMDHSSGTPELVKVVVTPLNDTAIVEGEVMDHAIVAEAIRQTLEATGVKKKQLVAAVGGRDVIVKKISIERVKEAQARELMRWEAEQHVPFDMESVELDFQILDPDGDGLEMSVLLVAAKRDLVEAKRHLLDEAGAGPTVIDVDAFALHNAFETNHPDAMKGTVALLNIGNEITNLNILDEGVPILTRDLTVGTRRFREDLQRESGVGADEAEGLLRGFDRHPALESAVAMRGEEIAVGVERAATFLATSTRNFSPAPRGLRMRRRRARPGSAPVARRTSSHPGAAGQCARSHQRARGSTRVPVHRRSRPAADAAGRTRPARRLRICR